MTIRVFLAGEGKTELGGRSGDPVYWREDEPGVLEGLLKRIRQDGWQVSGAVEWRRIRKLQVGGHAHADMRNVLGAALDAKENGCHVLVFTRDRDREADRETAVLRGVQSAGEIISECPRIVGGVAVEAIEAWLLALSGVARTETFSTTAGKDRLSADGRAHAEIIAGANFDGLPEDARSLREWLIAARSALGE